MCVCLLFYFVGQSDVLRIYLSFVLASLQIFSGLLSMFVRGLVVTAMAAVWNRGLFLSFLLPVQITCKLTDQMFHHMSRTFNLCVDMSCINVCCLHYKLYAFGRCGGYERIFFYKTCSVQSVNILYV